MVKMITTIPALLEALAASSRSWASEALWSVFVSLRHTAIFPTAIPFTNLNLV